MNAPLHRAFVQGSGEISRRSLRNNVCRRKRVQELIAFRPGLGALFMFSRYKNRENVVRLSCHDHAFNEAFVGDSCQPRKSITLLIAMAHMLSVSQSVPIRHLQISACTSEIRLLVQRVARLIRDPKADLALTSRTRLDSDPGEFESALWTPKSRHTL